MAPDREEFRLGMQKCKTTIVDGIKEATAFRIQVVQLILSLEVLLILSRYKSTNYQCFNYTTLIIISIFISFISTF